MLNVAIIVGSTRPNRKAHVVAKWVHDLTAKRTDATFEIVDIDDYDLPLLDEPLPPTMGQYLKEHTKKWAATIARFDAFVFVSPEYNHSVPAALKNAIDFLYAEWNNKAAGIVAYGGAGGARAIEHLRGVLAELAVATVRQTVMFSMFTDFENYTVFKPSERHTGTVDLMFDQVVAWGTALKSLR